jgi:hypothetical protein
MSEELTRPMTDSTISDVSLNTVFSAKTACYRSISSRIYAYSNVATSDRVKMSNLLTSQYIVQGVYNAIGDLTEWWF